MLLHSGSSNNNNNNNNNIDDDDNIVYDEDTMRAIQLGSLCSLPMALKAVINLGVLEALAEAHPPNELLTSDEIAEKLPILAEKDTARAAGSLERILRFLGSYGVLRAEMGHLGSRAYALNSVSRKFVGEKSAASFAAMNLHKMFLDTWQYLGEAVVDGGDPFRKAHGGTDSFSYVREHDPAFDALFNKAMADASSGIMELLLDSPYAHQLFGDGSFRSLLDLGGGNGTCLEMIVARFPHLTTAINFDQPHVVQLAPLSPLGIQHVGGDMFVRIPSVEAIFMRLILHDWSDKHCLKILENCYKALPQNGKIIIVDTLLPTHVNTTLRDQLIYQLDILMFAYNPGGKERTEEELTKLITQVGFSHMEVICRVCEFSVIQVYKA